MPTRELGGSQLIRLVDESRQREAAVEVIHDAPTRKCPAAARELVESARRDTSPVEARQLDDPGLAKLLSELGSEQATAMLAEAPVTELPRAPATLPVRRGAPEARQVRKRALGVLVLLCLGVLVVLCLGRLGLIDASVYHSLGM